MTTTGIKLDIETKDRLKYLAEVKRRSTHWLMKEAIGEYLIREERFEREKAEDDERYSHFLESGLHISEEAMNGWLDELAEIARSSIDQTEADVE